MKTTKDATSMRRPTVYSQIPTSGTGGTGWEVFPHDGKYGRGKQGRLKHRG